MAQNTHDPGTSAAINPPFLSSFSAAKPEGASKNLKALVFGSIGVVFGDIGTSHLYALQETFAGSHGLGVEPEKVLGGVSLTLWTLIALVTLKYGGQVFDLNRMSFFVSRETIGPRLPPGMAIWRETFFKLMLRNAASATDFFQIPAERVVELGTQIEI